MLKIAIIFVALAFISHSLMAKIYKYTDENGNVSYSDKKPIADGKENLKNITIIESKDNSDSNNLKRKQGTSKLKPFSFDNFAISNPTDEESLSNKDGNVSVSVELDGELPRQYRIKFYLDDLPHGRVKSNTQLIGDIESGEHTLYAVAIEARSRKVMKTTPKIKFYLK